MQAINSFFDGVDLIAERLPGLNHLIVELVLIGLVITGAYSLFKHRI
jgi:hypothetical protein